MKILWVKSDFLHPTNRGGQIRTLEMLKCLHHRHEVHFIAFDDGKNPEGLRRSSEYCSRAYAVPHSVPPRRSLRFAGQLVEGLVSRLPVSVRRYTSGRMKRQIQSLLEQNRFDSVVCDFLFPAMNIPDLTRTVLFQHNVESIIWRRHVEQASGPAKRAYFRLQARRMEILERAVCRQAGQIVAVSDVDRDTMRDMFGIERVAAVPTGVDLEFFAPPALAQVKADLVFVGSMDWMPNIDAMRYFASDILPLIRKGRPNCRIAIAGRKPGSAIQDLGRRDPNIIVTGTVPDVRPYLWGSTVCVVPLRVGGGTRLKIFEAMAAKLPVVSTSIGAEGLPVEDGAHILIADSAELFAQRCLELLNDAEKREELAGRAWQLVSSRFSWEAIAREFETILVNGPRPG
ncbi:MAG TPA: glycosyltransferase [Bryobacteraceae bacterium]|nr:glycosyltransferase [Bryobacteraceae bacterium]